MICSSTNWRTISVMAFCSSVFSENCGVASAMRSSTSRARRGDAEDTGAREPRPHRAGLVPVLGVAGRHPLERALVVARALGLLGLGVGVLAGRRAGHGRDAARARRG